LTQTIERLIRPTRRLRDAAGYPSGYKADLRRVLAFEADPREYNRLWVRKNIPHRGSVVFSLLVDLSGSMRGPKTDAALAGSVLLAETLHRLQVPFAVNGFQDVLIPFCDFAEGLTGFTRRLLGEMPLEINGSRPDGNNKPSWNDDGPCLLEAAEQLLDQPQRQRVLVVISDGWPEGTRSTVDDLHKAVAELRRIGPALRLVGIGLGPGTDHVTKFYPESIANVPLERLAEQIGALLSQALVEGYR
jgi:cobalamin biosynthesis protein CobT